MALTKAPLFGLDASGSLGGSIVFSKWKGRTYVRRLSIPHNPKSGLQVGMRAGMKFITQDYKNLSATITGHWKTIADKTSVTPMNSQVSYGQKNIRLGKGLIQDPTAVAGTTPNVPATGSATALPKSLSLVWTHPASNPGNYTTMIWRSTTTGFTPSTATLVAIVSQATLAYVDRALITGTPYYYRIAETNTDGTIGAMIAQFTGTPT